MNPKAEKSRKTIAGDIACVALLLVLSCLIFVLNLKGSSAEGEFVTVSEGNSEVSEIYSLSENGEYIYKSSNGYTLLICISDGQVWVKESDCPNRYCVGSGKISRTGDIIVCAPAKTVIKITGKEADEGDEIVAG